MGNLPPHINLVILSEPLYSLAMTLLKSHWITVKTVKCHFLSHFSFNFEIVSAHLEANIQNFLKCPQFLHFEWMWRKLHTAIFPQMTKERFIWGTLYKPLFSSHVTKQNSQRAEGSLFTGCQRKLDVHSNGHN